MGPNFVLHSPPPLLFLPPPPFREEGGKPVSEADDFFLRKKKRGRPSITPFLFPASALSPILLICRAKKKSEEARTGLFDAGKQTGVSPLHDFCPKEAKKRGTSDERNSKIILPLKSPGARFWRKKKRGSAFCAFPLFFTKKRRRRSQLLQEEEEERRRRRKREESEANTNLATTSVDSPFILISSSCGVSSHACTRTTKPVIFFLRREIYGTGEQSGAKHLCARP